MVRPAQPAIEGSLRGWHVDSSNPLEPTGPTSAVVARSVVGESPEPVRRPTRASAAQARGQVAAHERFFAHRLRTQLPERGDPASFARAEAAFGLDRLGAPLGGIETLTPAHPSWPELRDHAPAGARLMRYENGALVEAAARGTEAGRFRFIGHNGTVISQGI